MSLKLDELRKRLLQQQSGNDGGAADNSSGGAGGKIFGASASRGADLSIAPKTAEPSAATKVAEPSVENKAPASEPPAVIAAPKAPDTSPVRKPVEAPAAGAPEPLVGHEAEPVNSSQRDSEPEPPSVGVGMTAATPSEPVVQNELADAVAKVFEQTKAFQARLDDLSRMFEPIDRMSNSAARAFGPLRGFQKQMAQLARSFEPMRAFQQQLTQLAQTFEPMKALEGQLSQLTDSFQSHIGELIKSLEPVKRIRERIDHLAAAFDEAIELQQQFTELFDAFQMDPGSNGTHVNGLDAQSGAAR